MKKNKIIALALAGAITFMGAGYAAWTDNIQINATAKTGDLEVQFVENEGISFSSNGAILVKPGEAPGGDFSNSFGTVSDNGSKLTIETQALYPASKYQGEESRETPAVRVRSTISNVGSIDAICEDVSIVTSGEEKVLDKIRVERGVLIKVYGDTINWYDENGEKWITESAESFVRRMQKDEIKTTGEDMTLNQFERFLKRRLLNEKNIEGRDVILKPGEIVTSISEGTLKELMIASNKKPENKTDIGMLLTHFRFYLDKELGDEGENSRAEFAIKYKWKQVN